MRRIILKYLFLMHEFYDRGSTADVAYLKAIVSLIAIIILNIFVFSSVFGLMDYLPYSGDVTSPKYERHLVISAVFLPVVFLIVKLFKKRDVLNINMGKSERRYGYTVIIVYLVLLFCSFVFLAFWNKSHQ
jgi:hypothetical protein